MDYRQDKKNKNNIYTINNNNINNNINNSNIH